VLQFIITTTTTTTTTYLLQLSFRSVAGALTLVQTKPIGVIYISETIQKHSKNNTKYNKYKYTYYQDTYTLQNLHTHTHTHIIKQVTTTTVQDTHQKKLSQYNQVPTV
jgi:predicted P-loop ATPase/GTPase